MRTITVPSPLSTTRVVVLMLLAVVAQLLLALPGPAVAAEALALTATPDDRSVRLAWAPITGAARYEVRRDGTPITETAPTTTTWTDGALTNSVTHTYTVAALRADGSPAASAVLRTTPVDVRPPVVETSMAPTIRLLDGGLQARWTIPPEVAADVAEYRLFVNDELAGVKPGGQTYVNFFIGGLVNEATRLVLVLVDMAGNMLKLPTWREGSWDIEPPAIPIDLRILSCLTQGVVLAWDDVGGGGATDEPERYLVHRNGERIGETSERMYRVPRLIPGVANQFTVTSVDGRGNASSPSLELTVVMTAAHAEADRCISHVPEPPELPPAPYAALEAAVGNDQTSSQGGVLYVTPRDQRRYAGYRIRRGETVLRSGSLKRGAPWYAFPQAPGAHALVIELVDLHGQTSPPATVPTRTLRRLAPDIPSSMAVSATTVTWDGSDGATAYEIEVDGRPFATTTATSFMLDATAIPTVRTVRVTAIDEHGQRSMPSDPVLVTT